MHMTKVTPQLSAYKKVLCTWFFYCMSNKSASFENDKLKTTPLEHFVHVAPFPQIKTECGLGHKSFFQIIACYLGCGNQNHFILVLVWRQFYFVPLLLWVFILLNYSDVSLYLSELWLVINIHNQVCKIGLWAAHTSRLWFSTTGCVKWWLHSSLIINPQISVSLKQKICSLSYNFDHQSPTVSAFFSAPPKALRPLITPTDCLTASRPRRLSWVAFECCTFWRTCERHWSWWTTRKGTTCAARSPIPPQKGWQSGCMAEW